MPIKNRKSSSKSHVFLGLPVGTKIFFTPVPPLVPEKHEYSILKLVRVLFVNFVVKELTE